MSRDNYLYCNITSYINSADNNVTSSDNGCSKLYQLEYSPLSVSIYGIASPIVISLTLLTNCLVCIVLCKDHMRNPTNHILIAMAVSDTLTGLSPLPCFIYFYSFFDSSPSTTYLPYSWCALYFCLVDYLPTIFHTASVWLTVCLAVQRYVCVRVTCGGARPPCNNTTNRIIICFVFLLAAVSQLSRFFEFRFTPIQLTDQTSDDIVACRVDKSDMVARYLDVYFSTYYWFRILFIHLVPCLILIAMNALLVDTIRQTESRRRQLLLRNRRQESRRAAESSQRTRMLIVVVGLFLVAEIPLAVLLFLTVLENTARHQITDPSHTRLATLSLNFFVLLSYPINFFIYCAMSTQFRQTFCSIFLYHDQTAHNVQHRLSEVTTAVEIEMNRRISFPRKRSQLNGQQCCIEVHTLKNS